MIPRYNTEQYVHKVSLQQNLRSVQQEIGEAYCRNKMLI
jgi:hypothetical protein